MSEPVSVSVSVNEVMIQSYASEQDMGTMAKKTSFKQVIASWNRAKLVYSYRTMNTLFLSLFNQSFGFIYI